ncbi:MAG: TlpA family protein disulfide reductase [Gammaproteobacteria bacterium]|nr:TlpA family protein disulfide reductase [Gammaproteobacteria bacterium]
MKKSSRPVLFISILILAACAGWVGYQEFAPQRTPSFSFVGEGLERLPAFSFPDLEGVTRHHDEWKARVLIVNFWATWCPPCRQEMPLFVETQERYRAQGVQFVAIAIDDRDLVKDFSDVYGINFPVVIGGVDAIQLSTSLGNKFGTLPFTAIFDRSGRTRYVQAGEISHETLERQILDLL